MKEALFTWVHLSDIHVGHGDPAHRWDQKMVLREIARDVVAARAEGLDIPAPDALLVTGDVAFSGNGVVRAPDTKSREYEGAKAFLLEVAGKLGLAEKDVFVVPGNHDVDRSKDRDRNTARLVKALQSGDDALDTVLGDLEGRKRLAGRMAAYLAFAADLAPACLGPLREPEDRLSWSMRLQRGRGLTVRLVGLNTALLSSGDNDFGNLRLGNEQLQRTFDDPPIADDGELVIALSHHPLRGWLADAKDAEAKIRRYAHLHLCGHVHEAESEESRTGGGSHGFLRVVAGASHAEKQASSEIPSGHGYNFASVVADEEGELELRIWPRRWSDENRDLRQDVNKIPRGKRWASHSLGVRARPATAAPAKVEATPMAIPTQTTSTGVSTYAPTPAANTVARRIPETGPVRVYISYAPEDADLCKALETQMALLRRHGYLEITSSHAVDPGGNWRGVVDQKLAEAHVILLLLSNDYLASDYCYDVEMETARKRYEAGEVIVIPVLLRPVAMVLGDDGTSKDSSPRLWFQRLAPVPRQQDAKSDPEYPRWKPITTWKLMDEAFGSVVKAMQACVEEARRR